MYSTAAPAAVETSPAAAVPDAGPCAAAVAVSGACSQADDRPRQGLGVRRHPEVNGEPDAARGERGRLPDSRTVQI